MFRGRYSLKVSRFLTNGYKIIQDSFLHTKGSKYNPKCSIAPRISYVDIHLLLRAADIKEDI